MYNYGRYSAQSDITGTLIYLGVVAAVAVIGGIVLYFTFLNKKNDGKFKGFLGWLHDFLTFKKMFIENLLRITYLILTIFVTFASFVAGSVPAFFGTLLLGNLAVRIVYEFSLILLLICRNTTEINKNLSKTSVVKETVTVSDSENNI